MEGEKQARPCSFVSVIRLSRKTRERLELLEVPAETFRVRNVFGTFENANEENPQIAQMN